MAASVIKKIRRATRRKFSAKEILFKPGGGSYRGKRLLGGKLKMPNLPHQLWHKVPLIWET